ncbi:MAG: hypothetical protein QXS54_08310 [Candidatus Methanomethylicaceae archaeon]
MRPDGQGAWAGERADRHCPSAPEQVRGHGGGLQVSRVALLAIKWLGVVAVRQAVFGLWRFARDGAILIMGVAVAKSLCLSGTQEREGEGVLAMDGRLRPTSACRRTAASAAPGARGEHGKLVSGGGVWPVTPPPLKRRPLGGLHSL